MIDQNLLTQFNASISLIPDYEYFGLLETYVGKVPTPFHKPQLNFTLATFFAKDDVVEKIIDRIDLLDTQLISALYISKSLKEEDLCNIFIHFESYSYNTIINRVINLEERLIFLPDSNTEHHIIINPLLVRVLQKRVVSLPTLFVDEGERRYLVSSKLPYVIQSLSAIIIHNKKEKRKKDFVSIIEHKFLHFHDIDFKNEEIVGFLKGLHVYISSLIEMSKLEKFLSLSTIKMIDTLCIELAKVTSLPCILSEKRDDFYNFLIFIEENLSIISITSLSSFKRFLLIASHLYSIEIINIDLFCMLLALVGISNSDDKGMMQESPYGIIDTDFTVTFHPSLSNFVLNKIHYYADLILFDNAITFTISKISVFRAFDYHLDVEDILHDIRTWSKKVSPLLRQQIEYFYHEYQQIQIYDGMSVCVSERLEKIIDNYDALKPYIVTKIANRVYLFTREDEKKWRDELIKIGVTTLPSTIQKSMNESSHVEDFGEDQVKNIVSNKVLSELLLHDVGRYVDKNRGEEDTFSLKKEVQRLFPSGSVKDELVAKIDQKIIMLPSQIIAPQHKSAHISASGFDFNKKNLVIKTAMNHKSLLLEISTLSDEGELISLIGLPVGYTGRDAQGSVVIKTIPEGKEIVIPVQKIFFIKTVKKSIFFKF
ncbi:MAG: hypothetical protein EOM67_02775 [Spirochaetia bacterium]|nr:hypothetical protein [Spirochaetia bacterium]